MPLIGLGHARPALIAIPLLTLALGAVGASDFRFEPFSPAPVSAKAAGAGGTYAAQIAGFDTLFTNPAGLAYVDKTWSIARLSMKASGPLFDLPSALLSDDMVTGMLDLVAANDGVYIGSDITGPIAFGKVDRNFGFGIFNDFSLIANIASNATIAAGGDILMTGGYGLTVYERDGHSVALGLQLKGYLQTFLEDSGTAIGILSIAESLDIDGIPVVLSTGFGLDGGLMYRYDDIFTAGIVCRDIYTPVFSTRYASLDDYLDANPDTDTVGARLDPNLSGGVAVSIPLPARWLTISSWDIMVDYRDALEILEPLKRNPILNIGVGTELVLLDVVSLRAGIHETYLAAGLGLDLTACQLDFAFYGSELGIDPGSRPLLNMELSLSFEY